jgi:CysZ protein
MKAVLASISTSLQLLRKDKIILTLSVLPPSLGGLVYIFVGWYLFGKFKGWGEEWIWQKIGTESVGQILQFLLTLMISLILLFIFNWTFVLFLSIISSPFNDALSARVEKLLGGEKLDDFTQTLGGIWDHLRRSVLSEIKKALLILFLTIMAVILSFIPILAPLALFLSALLLSIQFLDYNWSRNNWSVRLCLRDLRSHTIIYGVSGMIFLGMMAIPLLNVFALPYAVVFYSSLWFDLQNSGVQVQKGGS